MLGFNKRSQVDTVRTPAYNVNAPQKWLPNNWNGKNCTGVRMELYPNPAQNKVMVAVPGLKNSYSIVVTDLTGRRYLFIGNVIQENYLLDVSGLSKGVFLYRSGDASCRQKLLKQ